MVNIAQSLLIKKAIVKKCFYFRAKNNYSVICYMQIRYERRLTIILFENAKL